MRSSVTEQFLKDRADGNAAESIGTGTWYSGFERVKAYAEAARVPFVAVWSNGDLCSLCKKLEANMMTGVFRDWMKGSGCAFWFGYSGDKAVEDKKTGKAWAKDGTLTTFPFMRFYWNDGAVTVNKAESGKWWNGGKVGEAGAVNVINHMEELLKSVRVHSASLKAPALKIRVNPEWTEEQVAEFRKAIKDNDGYCPCEDEHVPDTKCMCRNFREQGEEGNCHCGLYDKYYA